MADFIENFDKRRFSLKKNFNEASYITNHQHIQMQPDLTRDSKYNPLPRFHDSHKPILWKQEHCNDVNWSNEYGYTALIESAAIGDLATIIHLVKKGADVNQADNGGRTPLIWAILYDRYEVCKFLLENGASTTRCDVHWSTPFHVALLNNNYKIAHLILENGYDLRKYKYPLDAPYFSCTRLSPEGFYDMFGVWIDKRRNIIIQELSEEEYDMEKLMECDMEKTDDENSDVKD
jgi:ankyrin repeat protein